MGTIGIGTSGGDTSDSLEAIPEFVAPCDGGVFGHLLGSHELVDVIPERKEPEGFRGDPLPGRVPTLKIGSSGALEMIIGNKMGVGDENRSTHSGETLMPTFSSSLVAKACFRLGYHALPGEFRSAKPCDRASLPVLLIRMPRLVEKQRRRWSEEDQEPEEEYVSSSGEEEVADTEADEEAESSDSPLEDIDTLAGRPGAVRPSEASLSLDRVEACRISKQASGEGTWQRLGSAILSAPSSSTFLCAGLQWKIQPSTRKLRRAIL
jgi:hypothetical protein